VGRVKRIWEQWAYFNVKYFGGKLSPPSTIRLTSARSYDGCLIRKNDGTKLRIYLAARLDWSNLMGTLLHEMVHQYQAEVLGLDDLPHDKVFNSYCRWIERQTRFPLRVKEL
jgi:hypothetical protein